MQEAAVVTLKGYCFNKAMQRLTGIGTNGPMEMYMNDTQLHTEPNYLLKHKATKIRPRCRTYCSCSLSLDIITCAVL